MPWPLIRILDISDHLSALKPSEAIRSHILLESLPKTFSRYMQAVKQAKAVYRLSTPVEPVFVQWVVDPEKAAGFLVTQCCDRMVYLVPKALGLSRWRSTTGC